MIWRASATAARDRGTCGHLVAVEVGVESGADQRVDLNGAAIDENRLECLDTETVQRGCAVQQHRPLADDLIEDVPDLGASALDDSLGGLDVVGKPTGDEGRA